MKAITYLQLSAHNIHIMDLNLFLNHKYFHFILSFMDKYQSDFINNLKFYRIKKKLSQAQFAETNETSTKQNLDVIEEHKLLTNIYEILNKYFTK